MLKIIYEDFGYHKYYVSSKNQKVRKMNNNEEQEILEHYSHGNTLSVEPQEVKNRCYA